METFSILRRLILESLVTRVLTVTTRSKEMACVDPIRINDILLIMDNDTKRNEWRMGVVTEIIPGRDGEIHIAYVRRDKNILLTPTNELIRFA